MYLSSGQAMFTVLVLLGLCATGYVGSQPVPAFYTKTFKFCVEQARAGAIIGSVTVGDMGTPPLSYHFPYPSSIFAINAINGEIALKQDLSPGSLTSQQVVAIDGNGRSDAASIVVKAAPCT